MKKPKRKTNRTLKAACYFAFAALAVWLAVYGFQAMDNPYRTVSVTSCSSRTSAAMSGIIAREETTVFSVYSAVHIEAKEGQRIAAQGTVAKAYDSPDELIRAIRMVELEQEEKELENLLQTADLENTQQLETELEKNIRSLRQAVRDRKLDEAVSLSRTLHTKAFAAYSPAAEIEQRLNECRLEMASLRQEGADYAALIPASGSGLFSASVDGWESLRYDDLKRIEPAALSELMNEERTVSGYALGKLVSGTRWYYAALMDAEEAERLRGRTNAQIIFGRYYGEKLTMKLEWLSAASGGVRTVVLSCNEALGEMLTARKQEAELVLDEKSGLRVPRRSLHVDELGNPCVYVRTGLQAEARQVHVLLDLGDSYMVESDTLRVGDEVIVSGKKLFAGKVVS